MQNLNPEEAKALGFTDEEIESTTFYEAVGCETCNDTGYKGRTAIMEALYFNQEISDVILSSGQEINEEKIRREAMNNGMLSLRGSGRERIKEGVTTLEEIAAVTLEDDE
jgi:type IV pilus assembly protein PilB